MPAGMKKTLVQVSLSESCYYTLEVQTNVARFAGIEAVEIEIVDF